MDLYLQLIRPKTLFAASGPVIVGLSLAFSQLNGSIDILTAFLTMSCALVLQMATNVTNDYFDGIRGLDNRDRLGPSRLSHLPNAPLKKIRDFMISLYVLAFLLGVKLMFIGGWPIILIGQAALITAFVYTGGPLPLSYFALGEVLALFFFGPLATWGTYYLQTFQWSVTPMLIGLGPGLISALLMGINNLRDMKTDQMGNKTTLAILLGEEKMKRLLQILFFLSLFIPLFLHPAQRTTATITVFLVSLFFINNYRNLLRLKVNQKMNLLLAKTGQYLFFYSLALSLGICL